MQTKQQTDLILFKLSRMQLTEGVGDKTQRGQFPIESDGIGRNRQQTDPHIKKKPVIRSMLLCCDNKLKDGSKKEGKFLLTEPWLRPPAEEPLALQSHSRLITQRSFIQQLHFKSLGLEFRRESIGF